MRLAGRKRSGSQKTLSSSGPSVFASPPPAKRDESKEERSAALAARRASKKEEGEAAEEESAPPPFPTEEEEESSTSAAERRRSPEQERTIDVSIARGRRREALIFSGARKKNKKNTRVERERGERAACTFSPFPIASFFEENDK
jgi:hypothetical protein